MSDPNAALGAALAATTAGSSAKRHYVITRLQWALFDALLAAPAGANPRLRALLAGPLGGITPLTAADDVAQFTCGVAMLDDAIRRDAAKPLSPDAERQHAFALRREGRVAGYVTLGPSFLQCALGDSAEADPAIPPARFALLSRLAVDRAWHGHDIGTALLSFALRRAARENAGARAVYVHALSEEVKPFYLRHGFRPVPAIVDPLGVVVTLDEIARALAP